MDAEEKVNKYVWDVLVKIKEQDLLNDWRDGGIIKLGYISSDFEKILFWLQDEKVITLTNLSREKGIAITQRPSEEVKLKLIQPAFDEIYEEYREVYAPRNKPSSAPNKDKKEKLKQVIVTHNIIGKEKKFLQLLSNMKPRSIRDLANETKTTNCKSLKLSVQKKLKGTGLKIKTIKATGFKKDSYYQLEFLTR